MPLSTRGHISGGKMLYEPESKHPCPRCSYKYRIEEKRVSNGHSIFICPQCSAQWEVFRERSKPKPPPKPTTPRPPSYDADTPQRRRDLAGESVESRVAPSEV